MAGPVTGVPAFDPAEVAVAAAKIPLSRSLAQYDPALEQAVRIGLAYIDFTFDGDHPRYGTDAYAAPEHEGFPPTIVSVVDALTLWGFTAKAERLYEYWLNHFVQADGTIAYYGTSLSEFGQLLTSAHRLIDRGGNADWLKRNRGALGRIAAHVECLVRADSEVKLPTGVPEADENDRFATYFHNAAWLARGLADWTALNDGSHTQLASELKSLTLAAIRETWPEDPEDWWLSPIVEPCVGDYWEAPISRVTENRFGSYTNYRYWPELLSSGILPNDLATRVVEARLNGGGQLYGVTRFENHLDDWPLMDYMEGLLQLGRTADFHLSLWGHIFFHQAEGHMTAYEQVSVPPGQRICAYCLPCQLVAVRAAAYL